MLTIRPLSHTPERVPEVAGWIWSAFWSHGKGFTQTELEQLLARVDEASIPNAWLAWVQDSPAGCINLIENDDSARSHLRPWLAALYVKPEFRNQGIAAKLVHTVKEEAARLGETELFLGTDIPDFYIKQGARVIEREQEPLHFVMKFDL